MAPFFQSTEIPQGTLGIVQRALGVVVNPSTDKGKQYSVPMPFNVGKERSETCVRHLADHLIKCGAFGLSRAVFIFSFRDISVFLLRAVFGVESDSCIHISFTKGGHSANFFWLHSTRFVQHC